MQSPVIDRRSLYLLLSLVLLAAGLRLWYLVTRAAVIENEGAMYSMMANDLLDGRAFPHTPTDVRPQLVMGWFYPVTIAATAAVVRHTELAARLVSLVAGTTLVVIVFFLALRLYGRPTAWIAALLVALFPILIGFSGAAYCETLYMTLLLGALYCAMRCFEEHRGWAWLWAGILFGCAYLTRPEAIVLPLLTVIFMVVIAWLRRFSLLAALKTSAGLLLVFALFVVPYTVLFKVYTGHFLLEGKNRMNYTIGQRLLSGMPPQEATRGLDGDARPVGPQLDQLHNIATSPYPMGPRNLLHYFLHMAAQNKSWIYREIIPSYVFGSLLLPMLAVLGLFGESWTSERLSRELYLLMIVGFMFVILLGAQLQLLRYAIPLLPFGLLWASKGLATLGDWATRTTLSLSDRWSYAPKVSSLIVMAAPMVILLGLSAANTGTVGELSESFPENRNIKVAGLWLHAHADKYPAVMAYESSIPFYARGDWLPLPYADSGLALRYIAAKHPDFVVVSFQMSGSTPYADDWLEHGIADPRAKLEYETPGDVARRVRIYRWVELSTNTPAR
jgi:4-amino-4-deoxy-L-arabinose transferase-like glycosyltransferase